MGEVSVTCRDGHRTWLMDTELHIGDLMPLAMKDTLKRAVQALNVEGRPRCPSCGVHLTGTSITVVDRPPDILLERELAEFASWAV